MTEFMKREIFMHTIWLTMVTLMGTTFLACSATSLSQDKIVTFTMEEEAQLRSLKVDASSAYQSISLEINIQHLDSAERYDFTGQEWDLLLRSSDGERILSLYRNDQDSILQRTFTRDGLARLHGLFTMDRCTESDRFPRARCVPCETDLCTFHYDFVRSGQPLRTVEVQLLANGQLSDAQSNSDVSITLEPLE